MAAPNEQEPENIESSRIMTNQPDDQPVESPVTAVLPTPPVSPPSALPLQKKKRGWLKLVIGLVILAAIGVGGYLAYTSFQSGTPVGRKKLVYWGLWEDEAILRPILDQWEKENPNVTVEYKRQSKEQYRERLQSALANNEGPDLFRFHNTWVPLLKDELQPAPPGIIGVAEFEKTFYPVAVKDLVWDTEIYGLPLEIDTLALFYNEEIFRQAGKEPPRDWEELRTLASELTVRDASGQIRIAGAAMGGAGNIDHWPDILGLMLLQNGARLPQLKGRLAEDAINFYSYLLRRDKVWDPLFPNSTRAFAGEKLAMYFGFSWDIFEIRNLNPNLKFTVIPVPQIPATLEMPNRKSVNWASYWAEGVSVNSQFSQEAWSLLKYLSSAPVMKQLYQNQVEFGGRPFGEPYSRRDLAAELMTDPLVGPFIAQAETAQSWYMCSRTFDNAINDSIIAYFEDAINKVNEGGPVDQQLEVVTQGITTKLDLYKVPAAKRLASPVSSTE